MSRLSIRPRPLDIHKRIPIVKSILEFEDHDYDSALPTNYYTSAFAADSTRKLPEAHQPRSRKNFQEIPIPQYEVVDSYERDYSRTFKQPASYLRSRGARPEIGEFVECDLDNEDEDWLKKFNGEKKILTPEMLETILFKLEVLDHKIRERARVLTPTLGSPTPILLQLDSAVKALQPHSIRLPLLQSVYIYWKAKRERWKKPILRQLQLPPPLHDTNPYNVFRPREKVHRLHTRRTQRRENNVQCFEKLRLVRRSLDQAKTVFDALIKREQKKREAMEAEISLQRIQIEYKNEAQFIEDGITFPTFQDFSSMFDSSEDDLMDSDDTIDDYSDAQPASIDSMRFVDSKKGINSRIIIKREMNQRCLLNGWFHEMDLLEPVLLFTKPLDLQKLAAVGIATPQDPHVDDNSIEPLYGFNGRIGRGGRIIFDRWKPNIDSLPYVAPISKSND